MNASASPSQTAFSAAYDVGRGMLVWATGVADLETPVGAYLKLAAGRANAFLLRASRAGPPAAATRLSAWSRTSCGAAGPAAQR